MKDAKKLELKSSWRQSVTNAMYKIIKELNEAGVYRFTVRQLFYQLVSKGVIKSTRQDYKNFDALLVRLREEDAWLDSMFVDTSKPRFNYYNQQYWAGQKYFVEIWFEKDALREFFETYAKRYKVNLVVCRGYPSVTRLREAKEARHVPENVNYVVLYFGDFDPSGEDIFRWINVELKPYNIEVYKVALTREQVVKYKLPPMVPKKSDPRYKKYVKKYGEIAVELDALHPAVLRDIIRNAILKYMDVSKRLEVEVVEGIELEAYRVVDEVLTDVRKKLEAVAVKHIRDEVNEVLPKVYAQLLESLEKGEELMLERLYNREKVLSIIREELRKVL